MSPALVYQLAPSLVLAQVPQTIGYQGRLLGPAGPVNGVTEIVFAIHDTDNSRSPLWAEIQSLALTDGYYATALGSARPPRADAQSPSGDGHTERKRHYS